MDRRYEIEHIKSLCCTKKKGWREDNCPVVRGDYGDLERAWIKLTKGKAEHQRDLLMKQIGEAIERQGEFRRQERASGEFVPQPILISAFLNKKRYLDPIDVEAEKPVTKLGKCWKCDRPVHGPAFKGCWEHLYEQG